MGTVREYTKKNGEPTFHAEVRLKGSSPKRASFPSRKLAEEWIDQIEQHSRPNVTTIRHTWTLQELFSLYTLPFNTLLERAHGVHSHFHNPNEVQQCKLISIKTGGCTEDCGYCAQSSKYTTAVKPGSLMQIDEVIAIAKKGKQEGVTRICMGAAWRQIRDGLQFERVLKMVKGCRSLGLEVCCTLGMLNEEQILRLKEAGLFAYNHNLDTSQEHYKKVITTHTYQERLDTLKRVENAGLSVCCGGIFGMGETTQDRLKLILSLANREKHPESVPLNRLVPIKGTPFEKSPPIEVTDYVKLIAITRIALPKSMIRLSAGRLSLSDAEQALCFFAGANSIFVGDKLLTTPNPTQNKDKALFKHLGLSPRPPYKEPLATEKKEHFLTKRLEKLKERGEERTLQSRDHSLIDFSSNDYLGIARSKEMAQKITQNFEQLALREGILPRIGATGSRLLTGNSILLEEVEEKIAKYHNGQRALLFNSGYAANTGLLSCIAKKGDALLLDSQVHASTWDGAKLSSGDHYIFPHNDLEGLEKQLKRLSVRHENVFVAIESLYSMAGDLAPIEEMLSLCEQYRSYLIVDEAHATGVLGQGGRGAAISLASHPHLLARIFTFGKGLGCHGAAIVGSDLIRQYLINTCRTFIYTTAFPLHTLISIDTVYNHIEQMNDEREHIKALIKYFQHAVHLSPIPINTSNTPIQSIPIQGEADALRMSEILKNNNIDVRAIRYPTVRRGKECLRVCLHAFNTKAEIDRLVDVLAQEKEEIFIA